MANSVNDVMNVIASPDYGIKNIAGTNQEILAILQGTHNSKNNIYNIVDDVRNLLQSLVDTNQKKKSVEVKGNNQTKINHRHIQDILDETKGIRKAIDNLAKTLLKQGKQMPTVAKLSNKASEKVANAMIESMNKQNKGSGLTSIIDAFNKLKNISLKDIIVGNQKIKLITKIFKKSKEDLNIEEKDLNSIIKLINSAPEMMKSLSKIGWRVNRIIRNNIIEKLSDILIGKKSILSLSILLNKNKKQFNDAKKSAQNISTLVGNLFASTIFLTTAAITGVPALLGATLLEKIVDKLIPTVKKLSENKKYMNKAVSSVVSLTAFTGLMAASSLFLATIAVTGIPALLGSVFALGIIEINIYTCKIINKSLKQIKRGSIGMAVMSASLILFGIALGKITNATKGVNFKQVGVIATLTVTLALAVAGIGFLITPIVIGSIAVGAMSIALHKFAKAIKTISDTGTVPTKLVYQTLNSLKAVANFFKNNSLNLKAIKNAKRYKKILRPFGNTIKHLSKLKELGVIPMKLVHQTLGVIKNIADYYIENPIEKDVIKQAKRYKDILKPFGKTLTYLTKLKELGVIPMKLVHQTLNAMRVIENYYIENPIEKDVIKQAKMHKKILRPFGKTLTYLTKLKELGVIPMKLVYQTLNTMREISNYYIENPIEKRAIKQAKRYKDILKPFGKTIKQLVKLKELGILPTKLVYQTLNTIGYIANYYIENPIKKRAIKQAKRYKDILKPFGKTITYLLKLKEIKSIPLKLVHQVLNAMSVISDFYEQQDLDSIGSKNKAISISRIISSFAKSVGSLKSLSDIKSNQLNAINNIIEGVNNLSNINPNNISNIGYTISNALSGINTIDMDKVQSVTNMFSAFNGINKSESAINKFTESVKEFTNTCKNLMDAMSDNTNAINSIDNSGEKMVFSEIRENNIIESGGSNKTINDGVRIANVEEIAKTIAEKINGALSVDISDTQVQLLINGIGGNEWTITRY